MKKILAIVALFSSLSFILSCSKEENVEFTDQELVGNEAQIEQISAENESIADEVYNRFVSLVLNSSETKAVIPSKYISSAVVLTFRDSTGAKIVIINFGTGITGSDGKVRSGKVIMKYERPSVGNSVYTMRYDKFKVDTFLFAGGIRRTITREVENTSQTSNVYESVSITNSNNGKKLDRRATLVRYMFYGEVGVLEDNYIETYGTISSLYPSGRVFSKNVSEVNKLKYLAVPGEIVSGIATISSTGRATITINYGDGTADNKATVSDGTRTWEITLRKNS